MASTWPLQGMTRPGGCGCGCKAREWERGESSREEDAGRNILSGYRVCSIMHGWRYSMAVNVLSGIVRIVSGRHIGTGFVVFEDGLILTCAHVLGSSMLEKARV